MFVCNLCGKSSAPGAPLHKIVTQTRQKTYPYRSQAKLESRPVIDLKTGRQALDKNGKPKRKRIWIADEGGSGYEIAKEIHCCPKCACGVHHGKIQGG